MLLINQIKVKPGYSYDFLVKKIASVLKVLPSDIISLEIDKKSIDARKKPEIFEVLSVLAEVNREDAVLKKCQDINVSKYVPHEYSFNITGDKVIEKRPVIVGAGPCGLFAAYLLATHGYKPLVLERGYDVDSRTRDVEDFWNGGKLLRNSNVLFGEGGAGTFSDGKLNTLVKDKLFRNKEVLKILVKFGANPSILSDSKPHVGTDVLKEVVKNIRKAIIAKGGEFKFNAEVTDIYINDGKVTGVKINNLIDLECDDCILCIGHSARDTFKMLYDKGVSLEQKDFAVGVRIEHKQQMIDKALYSDNDKTLKVLPHASYKLTYKANSGRGVYSFCMCPGGFVVNASSEENRLCINGMSYSGRNGENANSAIVVTVTGEDFESTHPLAGIEFQRKLEEKAYNLCNGAIPVEYYCDFKNDLFDKDSLQNIDYDDVFVSPETKGAYAFGKVSSVFPKEIAMDICEGIDYFNRIIKGFSNNHTILSAVESRTSSPVRITRDEEFQAIGIKGLYPCGEGAGYAGGITSAAMDGMKVAEKLASIYRPFSI